MNGAMIGERAHRIESANVGLVERQVPRIPESAIAGAGMSDSVIVGPPDRIALIDNLMPGDKVGTLNGDIVNYGVSRQRKREYQSQKHNNFAEHDSSRNLVKSKPDILSFFTNSILRVVLK
jgi:hypothetical protein